MKPKKVLKMRFPSWDCSNYIGTAMFLHVALSKVDGRLLRTCTEYSTCRENFTVCMRSKFITSGHNKIDTSRAHVLYTHGRMSVASEDQGWQRILSAAEKSLKIVNAFERKYRWYPLTKAYPVDDDRPKTCVPATFFLGPAKWTMSPYLFSLYTLMIRLGRNKWIDDKALNLCGDHVAFVKKLYNLAYARRGAGGDAIQIHRSIGIWDILMSNYKELFGGQTRAYNWSLERLSNPDYYRNEGVQKLAAGSSGDKELRGKVREFGQQLAKEAKDVKKKAVHTSKSL